jgi:hypothetical protein
MGSGGAALVQRATPSDAAGTAQGVAASGCLAAARATQQVSTCWLMPLLLLLLLLLLQLLASP